MKKSIQAARPQSSESDSDGTENERSITVPTKVIPLADSFERNEHSWFVTSQVPTDLSIQVQDITFSVHKYPLLSKCGYVGRIELQPSISNFGYELMLENFPGGPEIFEIVLKFCYGLPLDLNPHNIAPLRCASEFLEMSEELEDGNLISKTEAFLTFVVLSSWKDTLTVLKSCENLSPWAENLQIVRRCCDSIAWKACRNNPTGEIDNEEEWWIDDASTLRIDHFMRIITSVRAKGMKPCIIGKGIMCYAQRWLTGMDVELQGLRGYWYGKNELKFSILIGRNEDECVTHSKEQKTIIENLISRLPPQQEAVSCKFLLKMLKMAIVYSASPALVSELEKRVGMTLESANVNDLLIPNFKNEDQGQMKSSEQPTMHNVDVVQRIIEYFLMHEQEQQQLHPMAGKSNVSKLLDNYLAEIARDPNLSVSKFQVLAEALPEGARTCHDGLYRAIDTYLKSHPSLSEHDRKRLCKTMNCEKLSLDACMHAAQNERLPLRTVIQVLFAEQVKMRTAMQAKDNVASGNNSEQEGRQTPTKTDIISLKQELESVKTKMTELQRDYSELQHEYEKANSHRPKGRSSWTSSLKKIRKSTFFLRKTEREETTARFDSQRGTGNLRRRMSMS